MVCLGLLELIGSPNNLVQQFEQTSLVVDQKFRVTDDVDEQNVRYLEFDLLLDLGSHR